MLRVVKKDLKPLRYHTYSSDDDDSDDDKEDDFLGIEDLDDSGKVKAVEADVHVDAACVGRLGGELSGKEMSKNEEVDSGGMLGDDMSSDDEVNQNTNDHVASDDSDGDMDDDTMLLQDAGIAEILKQRLSSGKDNTFSQLLVFKSRVLSLLEIFLQKHPGTTLSLKI